MICPNCSHETADEAPDCPACHVVFAKFKAAKSRAIGSAPIQETAGGAAKWIGLVVLVCCAWAFRHFTSANAGERAPVGAVAEKEILTGGGGAEGFVPPSDHCGYAGRVINAALGTPIPGAKVYFDAYVAAADPSGHYRVIVRSMRGGCEPFPSARHPNFQNNYLTRSVSNLGPEERLALKNASEPVERVPGKPGKVTVVNFSLFPTQIPDSLLADIAKNAEDTEMPESETDDLPDQ